jgi:hypothetical protein
MSDLTPRRRPITPLRFSLDDARDPAPPSPASKSDAMLCERCGKAEMYRMHAVWRCPSCGFKTDCCGW